MGSTIVASKTSLEKAIRLAWLDDLNTFGEDSYVYNNDEKLKALFGMKEAINSGMAGQRVFAYGAEKGLHVGNALSLVNGIGSANWGGLSTIEDVLGSTVAMASVNGNAKARRLLVNMGVLYTPIEWIESSGSQYIDTGYVQKSDNMKIECEFSIISRNTQTSLFGAQYGADNLQFPIVLYTGTSTYDAYVGSSHAVASLNMNIGTDYTLTCEANNGTFTTDLNGTATTAAYDGSLDKNLSLAIFGNNINGTVSQLSSMRLKLFRIYDNGELVRDFVPALDANDVACLYDKVERKYYYNNGSGSFGSSDASGTQTQPVGYTRVEYLQSGYESAFFNTGYYPNSNTRTVLDFQMYSNTTQTNGYYFGTYSGDDNDYSLYYDDVNTDTTGFVSHYFGGNSDPYDYMYAVYGYHAIIDKDVNVTKIITDSGETLTAAEYTTASGKTSTHPMYIMAANSANGAMSPKNMKFYNMQIYEGSELIHDYVAARDSDYTPCIYDMVTETALYNICTSDIYDEGSNVLVAGPDVEAI